MTRMRPLYIFLFLFPIVLNGSVSAQNSKTGLFMSPEEKAFMWHVVKKSPVLDRNIGFLFDYSGDSIYVGNQLDYDSMATTITMEPTLLRIDFHGLSNVRSGLLLETVTKMALWKLHKSLKAGDKEDGPENDLYLRIVKGVLGRAPENALRKRGGEHELKPDILELLDPGLPMGEKIEKAGETNLTLREQLYVLQAINDTYIQYIRDEGLRLFKLLGGRTEGFDNLLLAAGEGSGTAGLLGEVEKDEKGRLDQKKPIGIGLFTYHLDLGKNDAGDDAIIIKSAPIKVFQGYTGGEITTLHLSIWGFNSFFQTTVVIKAGGKSYLLYGSKYSKELNPDSTFGRGKTYHRHIGTLRDDKIKGLEEDIEGEDGLRVRVERNKELEKQALTGVHESEEELREYKLSNNRKKYKIAQAKYLRYSQTYEKRKERTKKSIERLQEAEEHLEYLEDKLYEMETNIGDNLVGFKESDSLYVFDDGSTFNAYTQDFRFGRSMGHHKFSVRLIAIGTRPLSKKVDEVQLYVNLTERPKEEVINYSTTLEDVFDPDRFSSDQVSISDSNEVLNRLTTYIVERSPRFLFSLKGHGVGMKTEDGQVVQATGEAKEQLDHYPGRNEESRQESRNEPEFRDLRVAKMNIAVEGHVHINIDSYTDPVRSSIAKSDTVAQKIMTELHIRTANDLLSGLRVFGILEALQEKLLENLENVDLDDFQKITEANNRIRSMLETAIVQVGPARLSYEHYQSLVD